MALDETRLAAALENVLQAAPINAVAGPPLTAFCLGFATEIIKEFKDNAELVIDIGPPAEGTIT